MRVYRFLLLLIVVDLLVVILHYWLGGSIGFFHIEKEQNLASVYSGLLLMTVGMFGIATFFVVHAARPLWERVTWVLLGLGFIYMGVDEMAVLHERVGFVANNRFGLGGYQGESFNWVIYYTPAIIASVFVFWGLLRILFRTERRLAGIALAGIVVLFLALGVEVWDGTLLNNPIYPNILVLEEFLEMFGESLFLTAVIGGFTTVFHEHYIRR